MVNASEGTKKTPLNELGSAGGVEISWTYNCGCRESRIVGMRPDDEPVTKRINGNCHWIWCTDTERHESNKCKSEYKDS